MFKTAIYQARRAILKNKFKTGVAFFLGNEEVGMNYRDNVYHFRQDSTFLYYFGIDKPSLAALIDFETGGEIIFGHENTIDDVIWNGPQPSLAMLASKVGVSKTQANERLWAILSQSMEAAKTIHFLPPYRHANEIKISQLLGYEHSELKNLASIELIQAVAEQRSIKSAEEIENMELAVNMSKSMHLAAMKHTRPNRFEYQVVGEIHAAALMEGGQLSYPIIYSVNGQTLHNHSHKNLMQNGQLALCDFGAETPLHYAGDITRTLPVSGKFTAKQAAIYNLVLEMYTEAIAMIKPGELYLNIHLEAAKVMLEGLKNLGFLAGNIETMLFEGVQGLFMPHGLGHMIGLDVHDMEDLGEIYVGYRPGLERSTQLGLRSLRLAKELAVGNTLTVEPGIYFIPELIEKYKAEKRSEAFVNYDLLATYYDFGGVRIEDNVLVTETGSRILGEAIPKTIDEIEAAMA